MASESPNVVVTAGGTTAEMLGQEYASKDPEVTISTEEVVAGNYLDVTVFAGEAIAGVPS